MKIVDPHIDLPDQLRGNYYGLIYDIYRNSSFIRDDDLILAKLSTKWHRQRLQRFQQQERILGEVLLELLEHSKGCSIDEDLLQQFIETKISLQRVMIKSKSFFPKDCSNEIVVDPKIFNFVFHYLSINNLDSEKPSPSYSPSENQSKPSSKSSVVSETIVDKMDDGKASKDVVLKVSDRVKRCLSSSLVADRSSENEIEINSNNNDICHVETSNGKMTNVIENEHSVKTSLDGFQSYPHIINDDISNLISNIDTIMNELTFWNVVQKTIEFKALGIDNSIKLEYVINRMLAMVIQEFASDKRVGQLALLMENLMDFKVPSVGPEKTDLVMFNDSFRKILQEYSIMTIKDIDQDPFGQRKLIGFSKIIAELYKLDALDGKLVLEYLERFVSEDQTKESMVECFYLMIEKLGPDSMLKLQAYPTANADNTAQNGLDFLINRLKSILKNYGCENYSKRTLNFSKEIIEKHRNNWLGWSGDHNSVYSASHFSSIRKKN